jgi:hypothetical protein
LSNIGLPGLWMFNVGKTGDTGNVIAPDLATGDSKFLWTNINLVIRFLKNGLFYMQIWLPLYFIYKMIINKKTNIETSE